jgi:hypothetical protein
LTTKIIFNLRIMLIHCFLLIVSFYAIGQRPVEDRKLELNNCLNSIYKMDFKQSKILVDEYYSAYPNQTSKYILKAYHLRWKYLPISEDDQSIYYKYLAVLDSAINSAENKLSISKDDLEESYFKMSAHIMKAELYAHNNNIVKAAFEGKNAFSIIKKGFEWCEQNPEFYISTGLYNYYIEFYRDKGFFYQSLLWPFSSGNRALGLDYLKKGNVKATFSEIECRFYLAHLNFKLENNPELGLKYCKELIDQFPNNLKFIEMYIENLLACKRFEEIPALLASLSATDDRFVSSKAKLFKGFLLFEQHGDFEKARALLLESLILMNTIVGDNDHFKSVAHLKLGELEIKTGNSQLGLEHLKKAKNLAKYRYIIEQIENIKS